MSISVSTVLESRLFGVLDWNIGSVVTVRVEEYSKHLKSYVPYAPSPRALTSNMVEHPTATAKAAMVGALLCFGTVTATAQSIGGTLLDRNTRTPVGGAYIVLLNADSLEIARALTDGLGRFQLHAPKMGSYILRTEVVGFLSSVTERFDVGADGVADLQLEAVPIRLRLDPLFIQGRARECRIIGDQALEVLAVWEEARKALAAVAWSDMQEEFISDLERFERTYTSSFVLRRETRTRTPTLHVMPFRSRSVQELEEFGYVLIGEDSVVYEAPDAEVFFSAPFLQNHCFWLEQDGQGPGSRIGLRFEPIRNNDRPDVSGVFWLDGESGALQRLQLAYVNVGSWQRERGAKAELRFQQLPDGRWFVERWWIRMPMVRKVESLKGPIWDFPEGVVGFEEEGGEVMKVYAADGRTLFARDRATVSGVVIDSTTGTGLSGAFVSLLGTDWVTISQPDGSYWLTDLPDGRYELIFTHPRSEFFGLSDAWPVRLRESRDSQADLAIPPPHVIVERRCGARGADVGLLLGYVRDELTDSVVSGANVQITWLESRDDVESLRSLDIQTDSIGVYRVCVPRGAPLSVEVHVDDTLLTAVPAVFEERLIRVIDIRVTMPVSDRQ